MLFCSMGFGCVDDLECEESGGFGVVAAEVAGGKFGEIFGVIITLILGFGGIVDFHGKRGFYSRIKLIDVMNAN